jgi:hypothetical protein
MIIIFIFVCPPWRMSALCLRVEYFFAASLRWAYVLCIIIATVVQNDTFLLIKHKLSNYCL